MGNTKSLESFIKETLTKYMPVTYSKQEAIRKVAPIIVKEVLERVKKQGDEYFETHKELKYTPYNQALEQFKKEIEGK